MARKGCLQLPHGLDFDGGFVDAALELDRRETVFGDEAPGLLDHAFGGFGAAVGIVRVGAEMTGLLVEEIAAIGHDVAHPAAQKLGDGQVDVLALKVHAGGLEGRVDDGTGAFRQGPGRQDLAGTNLQAAQTGIDAAPQFVEVERIHADEAPRRPA